MALFVLAACGALAEEPLVRYHLGDASPGGQSGPPVFAAPDFDDSAWLVAGPGGVPMPAFTSDGIVWIRFRLTLPVAAKEPLALVLDFSSGAEQVYAGGEPVGLQGQLPPHPVATVYSKTLFPLPAGSEQGNPGQGGSVLVAIRAWYRPGSRLEGGLRPIAASIGPLEEMAVRDRNARAALLLNQAPAIGLHLLLLLTGIGLLFLWRWSHRGDLGLFGLFLLTNAVFYILDSAEMANWMPLSHITYAFLNNASGFAALMVVVEFSRRVYEISARWFRLAGHLSWSLSFALRLVTAHATKPWLALPALLSIESFSVLAWDLLIVGACIFTIVRRHRNWLIALCMMVVAVLLAVNSIFPKLPIYPLITFAVANVCLVAAGTLVAQALRAFARSSRLASELEAAREIQQRLVPASLPAVAGYRIAAAFLPANEVGGDFYQVIPLASGTTLIVIGDVSGKGLKAAMTGTLAIGALRTLAGENLGPADLLTRLNRQIVAAQNGGFVTCLCLRVNANGEATVANAGHLAPYLDGIELALENCLPLGLTSDSAYAETSLGLKPGAQLTLLTDGVVEAQSPVRELFGFDRTAAISTESAQNIARAASTFGQEDDITVLTLAYAPTL